MGGDTVEDKGYKNRYVDVHARIKAFKDRLREANKSRADLCEDRLVQETKEMEIADKESPSPTSPMSPPSDPA